LEPVAAPAAGGAYCAWGLEPPWRFLPQLGQKLAPAVTWLPQPGQYCALTGAPQLAQNLSPGWTIEPHLEQFINHLTVREVIFRPNYQLTFPH